MKFNGLLVDNINEANIFICGIPFDSNSHLSSGSKDFPYVLRSLSENVYPITMSFSKISNIKMYDLGDFKGDDYNKLTSELQYNLLERNGLHIILGGDQSISIPSERAFYCKCLKENKTPVLIHFSAFSGLSETFNNNINNERCALNRAIDYGFQKGNINVIGVRELTNNELDNMVNFKEVNLYKVNDIYQLGLLNFINYLINKYNKNKYSVYISLDASVFDPSYVSAVSKPLPFGLSSYEVNEILCSLVSKLNVDVIDFVGVIPSKDENCKSMYLILKILYELLNKYSNKNNE